ncbi:MAG TPA: YetF domain-containing protein, partial [Terriglobales bacterium]|nr:YetF domain-containing protein [Terriglobales bacterium]
MDLQELALTALRATIIYVVLLVVVRLLGKRTVGSATAFDFMVALILSEVVDEPIYGDVPVVQALVVIAVIGGWHAVNSYLSYRSERFDRLTGGEPTVLVKNGQLVRKGMRQERVNEEELWSMLRLHGIDDL